MKGIIKVIESNVKTGKSAQGEWSLSLITLGDDKKYSTFDLKDYDCKVGDLVEFDMMEKDGKLGIVKGTLKVLEKNVGEPPTEEDCERHGSTQRGQYDKDPVGLAVEVFVGFGYQPTAAELEQNDTEVKLLMHHAIKLVKQAQDAFK